MQNINWQEVKFFAGLQNWRNEIDNLKKTIQDLEARDMWVFYAIVNQQYSMTISIYVAIFIHLILFCRHLAGENLSSLGMKDLKQLERQLRIGVERIRSKKVTNLNMFPFKIKNNRMMLSR